MNTTTAATDLDYRRGLLDGLDQAIALVAGAADRKAAIGAVMGAMRNLNAQSRESEQGRGRLEGVAKAATALVNLKSLAAVAERLDAERAAAAADVEGDDDPLPELHGASTWTIDIDIDEPDLDGPDCDETLDQGAGETPDQVGDHAGGAGGEAGGPSDPVSDPTGDPVSEPAGDPVSDPAADGPSVAEQIEAGIEFEEIDEGAAAKGGPKDDEGAAAKATVAGLVAIKVDHLAKDKYRVECRRPDGNDLIHSDRLRAADASARSRVAKAITGRLDPAGVQAVNEAGGLLMHLQVEAALLQMLDQVEAGVKEAAEKAKEERASRANASGRPMIWITPEEHEMVAQAIVALAADDRLFQRGGALATVQAAEPKPKAKRRKKGEIERPEGTLVIATLPEVQIRMRMGIRAEWWARNGEETYRTTPPSTVVSMVATMGVWPGIRPLTGIIEAPTLRPDGTTLDRPGYDDETGIVYQPSIDFPAIPDRPTREDARQAAERIGSLVVDFPFSKPVHSVGWLAAVLTLIGRHAIDGPCPIFLIDANVAGSGKSLLADLVSIIATGRVASHYTYTNDDDEMRKSLLAVGLAGDRMLVYDNVETGGAIGGPALDKAITSRTIKDRVLGASKVVEVPFDTVVIATGNNIGIRADAARRVIYCRLDSPEERPEERDDFRVGKDCPCGCAGALMRHAENARGEIVRDALTVLRAYEVADRPAQGLKPLGSFEAWSDLVRCAIHWAIGIDPCDGRKDLPSSEADTDGLQLLRGLAVLLKAKNRQSMSTAEIVAELDKYDTTHTAFRDLVKAWARDGKLSAINLGKRLGKIRRKNIGGLMADRHTVEGTVYWRVASAASSREAVGGEAAE